MTMKRGPLGAPGCALSLALVVGLAACSSKPTADSMGPGGSSPAAGGTGVAGQASAGESGTSSGGSGVVPAPGGGGSTANTGGTNPGPAGGASSNGGSTTVPDPPPVAGTVDPPVFATQDGIGDTADRNVCATRGGSWSSSAPKTLGVAPLHEPYGACGRSAGFLACCAAGLQACLRAT
jgi:hypothetical protein